MSGRSVVVGLVIAVAVVAAASPVGAQSGPLRIGEEFWVMRDTPHPLPAGPANAEVWRDVIELRNASYIAVHFSRFDLAPGEKVIVRTPDGRYSYTFAGEGKRGKGGNFWATHVPGDSCEVVLFGNGGRPGFGYTIDRYAAGYPVPKDDAPPEQPEALCGTDDSQWARCYETHEPAVYGRSRAVARLMISGTGACTGWLVGSAGHLVTNNHCFSDQATANDTDYEFMAEGATCGTSCATWGACPGTVVTSDATFIKTNAPIDYTLVQLSVNPTGTYGYLQLRASGPVLGERIYLPGHPQAWGKKIAVESTASQDPTGYAQVYSLNEASCQGGGPPEVGYFADTQGGSSGSPVLGYSDHKVVALHHCGTCPNRGLAIDDVIADMGTDLPPGAVEDAPYLTVQGSSFADDCPAGGPGDADGTIDPGETVNLTVTVNNSGTLPATGVSVTLSTTTPGVTLSDAAAAYPDLSPGQSAANLDALAFGVDAAKTCGEPIQILVTMASGARTWTSTLDYTVGHVFTTPLVANEGFEGTFPPTGWSSYKTALGTNPGWQAGQTGSTGSHGSPHAGTKYAWHNDDNLGGSVTDWLVAPQLAVPAGGAQLRFFERNYYGSYFDYHGVWVTTGTSPDPAVSTYVQLQSLPVAPESWQQTSVDLSAYAGQTVFLAFRYVGSYADEWYLDDVDVVALGCAANVCDTSGQHLLSVTRQGTGTGSVTSSPAGIDCGATCTAMFDHGTVVTLTAVPDPGMTFGGWGGDCSGTAPTCDVTVDAARTVTATFNAPRLEPAEVRIDSPLSAPGNGILEPGDTVVFHPAWHNPGSVGQAVAGTLANLHDALGGTWPITDGAAEYGTIAAGATTDALAQTGDAYGFTLPVPATRPAMHWDVLVDETLSTGESHTWTLHVGESFSDVATTYQLYSFVETLLHNKVTAGCSGTAYCPSGQVTRSQMAMFIARAMAGGDGNVPASGTVGAAPYDCVTDGESVFTDVLPTALFCRHVHYIAAQGVTAGCGGTSYCPGAKVSRAAMAMFIARAVAGGDANVPLYYQDPVTLRVYNCEPANATIHFTDVPAGAQACRHAHYLWTLGDIDGCGASTFCPASMVTRGQMAKFLVNGFDLTLSAP